MRHRFTGGQFKQSGDHQTFVRLSTTGAGNGDVYSFQSPDTETWATDFTMASQASVSIALGINRPEAGLDWNFDNIEIREYIALTESDYHRNDWWFEYLESQGYTGQLNDRELAYWLDLFESTTGSAYNDGYSAGYS